MPITGQTIPHDSARGHVTGTAPYLDDLRPIEGELHVGFVGSPVASGRIRSIDVARAAALSGVVGCFTADDVPGENLFGPVVADEPFLAAGEVLYRHQPVVVIAAESSEALAAARRAVMMDAAAIDVEPTTPILTIGEALAQERFLGPARRIARGDARTALAAAPHRLSGTFECGGQEQFYLESQAAIASPGEEGQIVVHSSTQNPSEIQAVVAEVLGLGMHQVVCLCKRMGGAFGGKETQAALPALMAALVASKTGRPARVVYDKETDMRVTGKRHGYRARWEVGFDDAGKILAYVVNFHSDGGAATDLSLAVLERTMLHAENTFYLPDVEITARVCFTNLPPNTAFRGFGGPQGMATIENVIEQIASHLALDAYDVRQRNLYGVGERNVTPYGQRFERNHLPEIFTTLAATSHYKRRRTEIEAFNATSRTQLRGIAMTGVKFGISFTTRFMNQANALVNVFDDGTVQVSTGGTEMGQGLNTKIRQLVADEFALAADRVLLMTTSTEKNHNTSPTAASASTDLNGTAAVRACRAIRHRLARFAARHLADAARGHAPTPEAIAFESGEVYDRRAPDVRLPFGQLCSLARRDRVNLGARGFYATPGVDFNRETGQGTPFFYFTQGAATAEVEIDRFTGELEVRRVDLLIDIGRSMNLGVDRGQIIGGFIQGMGWVTAECLVYDDEGDLLSYSPTTYKIPAISDVPQEFHVGLFDNDDNIQNIRRSKAVGEPPFMLGIAPWAAARQALASLDAEAAAALRLPATGEELLRCLTEAEARAAEAGGPLKTSDTPAR